MSGYVHMDGPHDVLLVLSANVDPLKDGEQYHKFTAYALLEHGGDRGKAYEALVAQGFGGLREEPEE